jgi:hypothetical protein
MLTALVAEACRHGLNDAVIDGLVDWPNKNSLASRYSVATVWRASPATGHPMNGNRNVGYR